MTRTQTLSLDEYVEKAEEVEGAAFVIEPAGAVPPKALENLRKLQRLGLLNGNVLMSLIAQAPIDPFGLFSALKSFGPWVFQPLDFSAMCILAKQGGEPAALMRLDLISDDITFVVNRNKQLVFHSGITGDEIAQRLAQPNAKASNFTAWLRMKMKAVVDEGMKNLQ